MRWIFAQDLDVWAETQIGRAEIARLVGRLIWATARTVRSFRFPSGDAAQIPGFDGHLIADAEGVPPFVPGGESVWEFGAGQDYVKKAQQEYRNRTDDPGSIEPSACTFVFVTPRVWKSNRPTLIDWQNEKKDGDWKNVMAIDAVALELWLEQSEAVAKDFAREVKGLAQVDGALSVREFWEEYSDRFRPKLVEQVVLCEREKEADALIQQLVAGTPQAIRLQADSRDEVVAFAAAAIRTAEVSTREFLEAHTLILETQEGVRQRLNNPGMIFLPRDAAVELAGSLSCRGPTVVPLARDDGSVTRLTRPSSGHLARSLKQMGFPEERAERLAKECGRSVTILARRIPSVERPRPPWVTSRELVAALMAGAWDDALEGDRTAVETLAGSQYEDFERNLRPLLVDPEPLEREGSVWKVRAPVDTFIQIGSLITGADIARLRDVAIVVFGEIDPALDLPMGERRYALLQGKKMRHSDWLRDGLASTLLQLAVLQQEANFHITGISPQLFVDNLISSLPGLNNDARLLISLGRQLPWLIEVAPHPLLVALEHLLEGDGGRILPIFEEDDSFLGRSSHSHILWALETLAWDPTYLPRVALDLARLARLDPGGKLVNRPIASLGAIFKAWMPQTKASLRQRLAAIDLVVAKEPDVGWLLVLGLLPARQGFGMPNPRPRLREPRVQGEETLTNGVVHQTYDEIVSRAIILAEGRLDRLLVLVKAMDAFRESDMQRVCDEIEKLLPVASADQQLALWTELRDTVSMHTAYREAQWALPPAIVDRLRSLQHRLDPADPILKIQWLFDKSFPDLDNARGAERVAAVREARSAAIRQLHAQTGDSGVAELARRAKFPGLVGTSAAELFDDMAGFDAMITNAYGFHDMPDLFPMALSSFAHAKFGEDWSSRVSERAAQGLAPERLATLILGWADERAAWHLAETLGPETARSYWSRRMPYPVKGDLIDQEHAAREYLKAGCALAALQAVAEVTNQLRGELVFQILDGAITEIAGASSEVIGNIAYEIGHVFDNLAARQDISQMDLARREYSYLWLLKHRDSTLALHRLMASDSVFFVSVLCDVFKPASGDEREPTAERKGKAQYGYELLSSLMLVPGFGEITDEAELRNWVTGVQQAAAENDRAKIADQFIGEVLAHSPTDSIDQGWPHRLVRDLIEDLASNDIERGIERARSNMQKGGAIDPKHPAALEHHLSTEARKWADLAIEWTRTAAMLNRMAEHWEWLAGVLEERGRQQAMRD